MSLIIDFIDETEKVNDEDLKVVKELLDLAAVREAVEDGSEVSVTFVMNDKIQEINREYRDKDMPTDVISFAMEELGEGEIQLNGLEIPRILGDIIISVPKAEEQATEYGHSFKRELGFLAVHGFLHLLGYDHETEVDEKAMFTKQKEVLDEYGLQR